MTGLYTDVEDLKLKLFGLLVSIDMVITGRRNFIQTMMSIDSKTPNGLCLTGDSHIIFFSMFPNRYPIFWNVFTIDYNSLGVPQANTEAILSFFPFI